MFSSGVSARALRFALASLAGSPAPLALRRWGPRPFPLRPPAPCGRALWASVAGLPRGERSRLRARAAVCRLAVSRPQLAARARLRRFFPRFARSCVSPRLAASRWSLSHFRCSRPLVPLAATDLSSSCAPCPRALRLRPLSLRRQPLSSTFPTLVVSVSWGFASIPLPLAVANVFLPHTTWGFPPNPQKKEQGAAPP